MVCAWKQTACWRDSETLWTHSLACAADNEVARDNLGAALLRKGKVDDAIFQFQHALQIDPNGLRSHFSLGSALLQKGVWTRRSCSSGTPCKSIQTTLKPTTASASLSCAREKWSRLRRSIPKSTGNQLDFAQAHYNLGNILLQKA